MVSVNIKKKDGFIYKGNFSVGNFDGYGIAYYQSGERYIGHWKAGKREGRGFLFTKNELGYRGEWKKWIYHMV